MKQVRASLRMCPVGGDYPAPTSEAAYLAHQNMLDSILPTNGGKLQADGTWLQEGWKLNPDWPQSLPGIARGAGQQYIPIVNNDRVGILTVLDSVELQDIAAAGLVLLARSGRFDSPWGGVLLDLEGIPSAYKDKLSDFLLILSYQLRAESIPVGISVRGIVNDPGPDYDNAYSYDFEVVAQAADFVDLRCYGYWNPTPRSIAPHWWVEACVQYALSQGIPAQRVYLGLGNFARYWPITGNSGTWHNVTAEQAASLIRAANSFVQWIESNGNGLVREKYADVGEGHIWLHDGDTLRHGLDLIDEYGLGGLGLFIPGMGDESVWQAIAEWKAPEPDVISRTPTGRMSAQKLGGLGGVFTTT